MQQHNNNIIIIYKEVKDTYLHHSTLLESLLKSTGKLGSEPWAPLPGLGNHWRYLKSQGQELAPALLYTNSDSGPSCGPSYCNGNISGLILGW